MTTRSDVLAVVIGAPSGADTELATVPADERWLVKRFLVSGGVLGGTATLYALNGANVVSVLSANIVLPALDVWKDVELWAVAPEESELHVGYSVSDAGRSVVIHGARLTVP